ncbi:hypothetical protein IMSAG192_01209 [Muribaculaceae bacterium]|nr:hypothetical protein IMSAG192_01209 [Muribaculaceae bacterium]
MLCYAASFACDYVGVADIVEERCLTVVDVAHYGYNRWTVDEVFLVVFFLMDCLDYLGRYIFGLETELFGYNIDSLGVKALVDGYHHTEIHTSGYDFVDGYIHHYGQVVGGNEFGEFQHSAFGCFGFGCLAFARVEGLTFLFTPFYAFFLAFVFVDKASESFFYLLLYILFRCRGLLWSIAAVAVFAFCIVSVTSVGIVVVAAIVASAGVIIASAVLSGLLLVGCLFNVDLFFANAVAPFFALSGCSICPGACSSGSGGFCVTLIAAFFLCLSTRAS